MDTGAPRSDYKVLIQYGKLEIGSFHVVTANQLFLSYIFLQILALCYGVRNRVWAAIH